jgi:hypothetical protein
MLVPFLGHINGQADQKTSSYNSLRKHVSKSVVIRAEEVDVAEKPGRVRSCCCDRVVPVAAAAVAAFDSLCLHLGLVFKFVVVVSVLSLTLCM